jgi:hypothetical protein
VQIIFILEVSAVPLTVNVVVDVDDCSTSFAILMAIMTIRNHKAVKLHLNIFNEKADPFFFVQWSSQIMNPNTMRNGAKTAAPTPQKNFVDDDKTMIMVLNL